MDFAGSYTMSSSYTGLYPSTFGDLRLSPRIEFYGHRP